MKRMLFFTSLFLFFMTFLMSLNAKASSYFTLHIDNDLLYGTDRDYTGGFKFKFTENELALNQKLIEPFDPIIKSLGLTLISDQVEMSIEAFTLGKNSPSGKVNLLLNEAWTHVDLRRFYKRTSQQIAIDMSFGWLGPNSPGKSAQNKLHKLIGNDLVEGARYHLPDQPTFMVGADIMTDLFSIEDWQFYQSSWLKLGSPQTQGFLGIGVIRSVNSDPVFKNNQVNYVRLDSKGMGYFYFGSIGMSYLWYSALVDGRLLALDDPLLPRYRWIPMIQYGAGMSFKKIAITLTGNAIGKIYKDQPENVFRFASLTMTCHF